MHMNKIYQIFLLSVCCIAIILRFVWLDFGVESILNRDEAALAYNGYLLKEVGMDEWGRKWPMALESFGDYKLLGYPLLLTAFFSIFGVSDAVVRLPSAVAGMILIIAGYYFAGNFKLEKKWQLLFSFLIATTPVFFFYSRIAFEANVGLALLVVSIYFAYISKQKWWFQVLAGLCMFAACATYNTPLLYIPFISVVLVFWHGIKNWKRWIITLSLYTGAAIFFFTILSSLTAQKSSITIFSDELTNTNLIEYRLSLPTALQPIIGNKYVYFGGLILQSLVKSFDPTFVVIRGGSHPWHTLPNWGNLLLPAYLFSMLGIVSLIYEVGIKLIQKKKLEFKIVKSDLVLLALVVISLLPASITVDSPHTTRSLFFFFVLILVGTRGLQLAVSKIKNSQSVLMLSTLFLSSTILIFSSYIYTYFTKYPEQMRSLYQGGLKSTLENVEQRPDEQIAFVDVGGYHYVLVAWYLQLPPDVFYQTIIKQNPDRIGFRYGERVDRFHFIGKESDRSTVEKTLISWEDNYWEIKE